jgi:hypothetical protein
MSQIKMYEYYWHANLFGVDIVYAASILKTPMVTWGTASETTDHDLLWKNSASSQDLCNPVSIHAYLWQISNL